ncbi:MAG: SNF2 helicase associated domain-containing protein [Blautia sp.]|nr:SNF2 helicase associated domain-containing protein [Blautia sp.]
MAEGKNWEKLFTPQQLEEGRSMYLSGRAKKMVYEDGVCGMTVRGDRNYEVKIFIEQTTVDDISCSCENQDSHGLCSHMAAAMFFAEEQLPFLDWKELPENSRHIRQTQKTSDKKALLALRELDEIQKQEHDQRRLQGEEEGAISYTPQEYRYFHYENYLKGLDISAPVLNDAQKLLREGDLHPLQVKFLFENKVGSEAQIGEAILKSEDDRFYYGWQANVSFGAQRILSSSCSNYACGARFSSKSYLGHTLCRHQVAAILLLQDYLKKENPGDTTNMAGMSFMNHMVYGAGASNGLLTDQTGELIHIVPYLTIDAEQTIRASFRIGKTKMYKMKSIPETIKDIDNGREVAFGKTKMLLGKEYIGEDSLPWLDFLRQVLLEEDEVTARLRSQYYNRYYAAPELPKITSDILLSGARLDQFFELAMGSSVEIVLKDYQTNNKGMYLFQDRDIQPTLEIKKDQDEKTDFFNGLLVTGDMPEFQHGRNGAYYIQDNTFNRISEERYQVLLPLIEAGRGGYIRMRIGRNHMADFYHKTLPRLKDIADIVEYDVEEIGAYLPPEPSFCCFLDFMNDQIICRAEVCYGPQIFNLYDVFKKGEDYASYRDEKEEMRILTQVAKYLRNYDADYGIFFGSRDEEAVFEFLSVGIQELMEICEVRATERFKRLRVRRSFQLQVGVSVESTLMDLEVLSKDLTDEELLDVIYSYRQKRRFARLKNGDFIRLDQNDTIAQLSAMLEALHIPLKEFVKGKMQIPAYRALYLEKMLELFQNIYAERDTHFRKLIKEFKTVEDADYDIPQALRGTLRKYQETGYQWLRTLDHYGFGGILADEMGLGKTLQVITVMLAVYQEERKEKGQELLPSLVVCPASLVFNWGEELRRFAPELTVYLVSGTMKERKTMLAGYQNADVLVTSYDLLKRDILEYEGKEFRFQIIDEAQYIKNAGTAAAKSVKLIRANTRFALTGTPIENRLAELWSIFDFLMPGFLYEYENFRTNYETPIVKYQNEEANAQLRRMVTPFILRRLKENVLHDLPEKLEEIRYAKMESKQQKLYDGQVVRMKTKLEEQSEAQFRTSKIEYLAELMRIRQICCDPSLCFENYNGGSAKREICMDLVRSLVDSDHKALIFSQFTSMFELLEKDLEAEGIAYYKITGATPKEKRLAMVKKFNEDKTPIFLVSLKAGGTGLNLVGADVVIHYDPWWNLAVQNQATDRAHRIGQTRIVTVYKLITKGTIEEKIVQMQDSKKKLADDILSGEGISSGILNREDLLALLE